MTVLQLGLGWVLDTGQSITDYSTLIKISTLRHVMQQPISDHYYQ